MAETNAIQLASSPHQSMKKEPSLKEQPRQQVSGSLRLSRKAPSQKEAASPVVRASLQKSTDERNEELSCSLERSRRQLEQARRDNEAAEVGENPNRVSKTMLASRKSPSRHERPPVEESKLLRNSIVGLQQKKIDELK